MKRIAASLTRQIVWCASISATMAQTTGSFTALSQGFGGTDSTMALLPSGKVFSAAGIYDPHAGTFTSEPGQPFNVAGTATTLPDGRVLITQTGGTSAVIFNPNTQTYTLTGSMAVTWGQGWGGVKASALSNGKVLLIGFNADDISAEIYDPDSGLFTPSGTWPGMAPLGTATLLADGSVLVTEYDSGALAIYDPGTAVFTPIGGTVAGQSAVLLASGKVLFTGKTDDLQCGGGPGLSGTLYDPSTRTLSPTAGRMTVGRLDHTATLLGDGTVLLTGGQVCPEFGGPGDLVSAEIYNPATETFVATGSMISGRFDFHTTLLSDGTVLVGNGNTYETEIAEFGQIYHPANPIPSPALFNIGKTAQAAVWNAVTGQLLSANAPARVNDLLALYTNNLIEGGVIPPQISVGGKVAKVLYVGDAPGYPGYFQVNFEVPLYVTAGSSVPVVLSYMGRSSNEVIIAVQ